MTRVFVLLTSSWIMLHFLIWDFGLESAINPGATLQTTISTSDANCSNLGGISIEVSGQNGPYIYQIYQDSIQIHDSGLQFFPDYSLSNLGQGNYQLRVEAATGYLHEENFTIAGNTTQTLQARVSQHITCREGNILMNPQGGVTPHQFAIWSFTDTQGNQEISYPSLDQVPLLAFQSRNIFDIYEPGIYIFVLMDDNNCRTLSNPVEIELRPSIDYSITQRDISCFGETDGAFRLNIIDSNGYLVSYTLTYPDGTTEAVETTSFTNLEPGDYQLTITQTRGGRTCDYIEYFTISSPEQEVFGSLVESRAPTCTTPGEISVINVVGGTPPYRFSIDGITFYDSPTNAYSFDNLAEGNYTVTIRDSNNCEFTTDPLFLLEAAAPTALNFETFPLNCDGSSLQLNATADQGIAPFQYEIISPSSLLPDDTMSTTAQFSGLEPGQYTVRVTDANGCQYEENAEIQATPSIAITQSQGDIISCFGQATGELRFSIENFTSGFNYILNGPGISRTGTSNIEELVFQDLPGGNYDLEVVDLINGCHSTQSLQIEEPLQPLSLAPLNPPVCPNEEALIVGASGGWDNYLFELIYPDNATVRSSSDGVFDGLNQNGIYVLRVRDERNCLQETSFELNAVIELQLMPSYSCLGNTIQNELRVQIPDNLNSDNWIFAIDSTDPSDFFTQRTWQNLTPGEHFLSVLNENGCQEIFPFVIEEQTPLSLQLRQSGINEIEVVTQGGQATYQFFFNGEDYGANNRFLAMEDGIVQVRVVDQLGCEVTGEIEVVVCTGENPDFFTPDGDSIGDLWTPGCPGIYPDLITTIYDRFGREIRQIQGTEEGWNGTYNGSRLPSGDYWYIMRFTLNNETRELIGHFSLVR